MRIARPLTTVLVLALACGDAPREVRTGLSLAEAMGGDTTGFRRATAPREFVFPGDHGPHPGFRVEWWYFTGNLTGENGRRFGFMLTFFRSAQTPEPVDRASAWAADDLWMAHFALTDAGGERHLAFERFARGAAGLAGARAEPFRVHLEDWTVASVDPATTFPVRIEAAGGDVALTLTLDRGRPPVLQGDAGLSRKGPEPGNASYYYSLTRMPAHGTVSIGETTHRVEGTAWTDREWSTSALSPDLAGWDWFALQLDDGTDLMLYQLRRHDGTASPFSAGMLVPAGGEPVRLGANEFRLAPEGSWRSALDGAGYPATWRVRVPARDLDLTVTPIIEDQEMDLTVRYWEGAVDVGGNRGGVGYLEMTGYGEREAQGAVPSRAAPAHRD